MAEPIWDFLSKKQWLKVIRCCSGSEKHIRNINQAWLNFAWYGKLVMTQLPIAKLFEVLYYYYY